jgi:hypothetical protein
MGYKYLHTGESVLVKQKIRAPKGINTDAIKDQLVQERNSRFLSLPIFHLVYIYNWGLKNYDTTKIQSNKRKRLEKFDTKIAATQKENRKSQLLSKKARKLTEFKDELKNGNRRMQWGETLTVFDSSKTIKTVDNINKYMFTRGYFNSIVNSSTTFEYKNARITYEIQPKKPYVIDSVYTFIADPTLDSLYKTKTTLNPLKGQQFSQELITQERERVYKIASNNGFYEFKKQYILFEVDSVSLPNQKLLVRLTITNPANRTNHRIYSYDSLIFNSETSKKNNYLLRTITYNDITYNQAANNYAEKILDRRIFLDKSDLYSREKALETQKQLSYLDIFRFVNIEYDTTDGKFISNIFTSPLKKFQTSTEIGLSLFEEAQKPGPFFNFNAKNRNLFHRLEIIDINANVRLQGIPNVNADNNEYTRFQAGAVASLTFPIFYFPLSQRLRNKYGAYNPRTRFSIGINYEDRFNEYERTTFNSAIAYLWQVKQIAQFSVKPLDVSFIQSNNSTNFSQELQEFEDQGNRSYVSAFRPSFVSAASISYNLRTNKYGQSDVNATFLSVFIEYGGLLQTFLGRKPFDESENLEYYRYFKFNADFRKNIRIKKGSSFAYRFNTGFAYVYGESRALPYEKYFFAGGSNSIRAWSPRRLGPGSYAEYTNVEGNEIEVDYQREQPADVIIESSIEYRKNVIGFFNIAAFIYIGNAWLWRSKTINENNDGDESSDGIFRFQSFIKEIAVGAGIGLRMDFSFLILRLDGAYKIVDPARPEGDRFVANKIRLDDLFNQQLFNLNIGIGYPF